MNFLIFIGKILFNAFPFLLVFYFLFPVILVVGDSMCPTYKDGKFLFSMRVLFKSQMRVNDVYAYKSPEGRIAIKRLTMIKNGKYFFEGDNREISHDSRDYGYIPFKNIKAHILNSEMEVNN